MTRRSPGLAALAAGFLAIAATARAGEPSRREVRCLGLVAFTEAAVDGPAGMAAVIRVVRNRAADPRFPDDACAVVAQVAQFQPVAQSAVLRRVVRDPEGYDTPPGRGRPLARGAAAAPGGATAGARAAAFARPDGGCAVLRQPRPDGRGKVSLVRGAQAHGADRRAPCSLPSTRRARRGAGRRPTSPPPGAARPRPGQGGRAGGGPAGPGRGGAPAQTGRGRRPRGGGGAGAGTKGGGGAGPPGAAGAPRHSLAWTRHPARGRRVRDEARLVRVAVADG